MSDRDYEYQELKKSNELLKKINDKLSFVVMWLAVTYFLQVINSITN